MVANLIPLCWGRLHGEFRAQVDRITPTDWRITITLAAGGRRVLLYDAMRHFRRDQSAKSFADNMLRRLTKHRCDFRTCADWMLCPAPAPAG